MNFDDLATLETLEQYCPGASAEFCMAQLKALVTIGVAMQAHTKALATERDEAVKKAATPPSAAGPKVSGAPVAATTTNGKPDETSGDDFDSLVRLYMKENPSKSRKEAVIATVRKHPDVHRAYLEGHPKNQLGQVKRKIADRAEVATMLSKGKLRQPE